MDGRTARWLAWAGVVVVSVEIQHGVLGDECAQTLKSFFAGLREARA
jgi:hypothetical protein